MLTARRTARIALAAALAWPAATAAPGVALVAKPEVLLLGGRFGQTASTAARTDPGRLYAITVSGVVSYNQRLALLDCGHFDPPSAAGWTGTSAPLLDGVPSPCTAMETHVSHTYCWTQRGTGDRLVFAMTDKATGDDVGGLVVVVDPTGQSCVAELPVPQTEQSGHR